MKQLQPSDWYKLVQDNNSYWYIIPVGLEQKFRQWVELVITGATVTSIELKREINFDQFRLPTHPTNYQFKEWR